MKGSKLQLFSIAILSSNKTNPQSQQLRENENVLRCSFICTLIEIKIGCFTRKGRYHDVNRIKALNDNVKRSWDQDVDRKE